MALVLNGQANTIGGLAVGGLPDGSIATADLADNAVTADKSSGLGINEYDRWRITSTFTGASDPLSSNWERNDNAGFEKIGTGMTQSSGVFTFPSTGKWLITFASYGWHTAATRWTSTEIDTTVDTGSNWVKQVQAQSSTPGDGSGAMWSSDVNYLFDVTNVSTHQCRFVIDVGSGIAGTTSASTNTDNTWATFMKLGET